MQQNLFDDIYINYDYHTQSHLMIFTFIMTIVLKAKRIHILILQCSMLLFATLYASLYAIKSIIPSKIMPTRRLSCIDNTESMYS